MVLVDVVITVEEVRCLMNLSSNEPATFLYSFLSLIFPKPNSFYVLLMMMLMLHPCTKIFFFFNYSEVFY